MNTLEKIGGYEPVGIGDVHKFVFLAYEALDWINDKWKRSNDNGGWGKLDLRPHDLVDESVLNAPYRDSIDEIGLRIKGVLAAGKYAHEVGDGVMENELLRYEEDAQRAIAGIITDFWFGTSRGDTEAGDLIFNSFSKIVGGENAFYWLYTAAIDKGLQMSKTEYQDCIVGEPENTIKFWRKVGHGSTQLIFDDQLYKDGGTREALGKNNEQVITYDVRSLIASKGPNEKRLVEKFEAITSRRAEFGVGLDILGKIKNNALSAVISQKLRKFGIGTNVDKLRVAEGKYREARHEYVVPVGASVWFGGLALLFGFAALEGLKRGMPMFPEPGSFGDCSPIEAIVLSGVLAIIATPLIPSVFDIDRVVEAREHLESVKKSVEA
ncbi:MAG: hypothetical protein DPW11_03790 [bacterium]|nr:hypothetical protein [Candidatus Microgenomates bacterium CPR3]MCQ3944870.1 hypothetical protein [bacterium]RIK52108.1 MAG: hypothetical protein DCC61_00895 [Candidatus Microgenomates bacterium]